LDFSPKGGVHMALSFKKLINSKLLNTFIGAVLTAFLTIWFATIVFVPKPVEIENKITAPSKTIRGDDNYSTDIYFAIKNKGMIKAEHIKIEFIIDGGKIDEVFINENFDWKMLTQEDVQGREKFQILANIPRNQVLEGNIAIISKIEYKPNIQSPLKIIIK
jgi:hypothetical protein